MSDEIEDEECECESDTMNSEDWIKAQAEYLKKIKKFKVKKSDRLHSVTELSFMHKTLCDTVLSWSNWVNGWVSIELGKKIDVADTKMVTLTDAELEMLHAKYKEFTTQFLEMDMEITKSFTKRINEMQKTKAVCASPPKNEAKMVV